MLPEQVQQKTCLQQTTAVQQQTVSACRFSAGRTAPAPLAPQQETQQRPEAAHGQAPRQQPTPAAAPAAKRSQKPGKASQYDEDGFLIESDEEDAEGAEQVSGQRLHCCTRQLSAAAQAPAGQVLTSTGHKPCGWLPGLRLSPAILSLLYDLQV